MLLITPVVNVELVAICQSVFRWVPTTPVVAYALATIVGVNDTPVLPLIGDVIDGVFTILLPVVTENPALVPPTATVTVVVVLFTALLVCLTTSVCPVVITNEVPLDGTDVNVPPATDANIILALVR